MGKRATKRLKNDIKSEIYCEICNINSNSESQFITHISTPSHIFKLEAKNAQKPANTLNNKECCSSSDQTIATSSSNASNKVKTESKIFKKLNIEVYEFNSEEKKSFIKSSDEIEPRIKQKLEYLIDLMSKEIEYSFLKMRERNKKIKS
jgi:hypothetical protein